MCVHMGTRVYVCTYVYLCVKVYEAGFVCMFMSQHVHVPM